MMRFRTHVSGPPIYPICLFIIDNSSYIWEIIVHMGEIK